jgi:CBS domain-containing protein
MTSARLRLLDVNATPRAAAVSLSKPGIGLVVICHRSGAAAGVLSKSDLIRHLADPGPAGKTVSTLMSRPIVSCRPEDDVRSVWQMMSAQGLQNVPVLGPTAIPLGILDIRDAMKALFEQEERQEQLLADYIAGVGYQ